MLRWQTRFMCGAGVGIGGHAGASQSPGGHARPERPVRGAEEAPHHRCGACLQPRHCLHGRANLR